MLRTGMGPFRVAGLALLALAVALPAMAQYTHTPYGKFTGRSEELGIAGSNAVTTATPAAWQDYGWDYPYSYYDPYLAGRSITTLNAGSVGVNANEPAFQQAGGEEMAGPPPQNWSGNQPQNWNNQFGMQTQASRNVQVQLLDIRRLPPTAERPEIVQARVRTANGKVRNICLGDTHFFDEQLPNLEPGTNLTLFIGRIQTENGLKNRVLAVQTNEGTFPIPQYEFNRVIAGRVVKLHTVPLGAGNESVVATIQTPRGRYIDVLLGAPGEFEQRLGQIRPGEEVSLGGYVRMINGHTTFFIQNMAPPESAMAGAEEMEPGAVNEGYAETFTPSYTETYTPRYTETYTPSYTTAPRYSTTPGAVFAPGPATGVEMVRGWLEDIDTRTIGGLKHWVAKVDTRHGDVFVDLGLRDELRGLGLHTGQWVTIWATRTSVGGRTMLRASEIDRNGQTVYVNTALAPAYATGYTETLPSFTVAPGTEYAAGFAAEAETVHGVVKDTHIRKVLGERRLVADIRTDEGQTVAADLGPRDALKNMRIKKGDPITATGNWEFERGKSMLHAQQFDVAGRFATVTQPLVATYPNVEGEYSVASGLENEEPFITTPAAGLRAVNGQIVTLRTAQFENIPEAHVLAMVRLNDGNEMQVDLGPATEVNAVTVGPGDFITVRAARGTINDRPGLIAHEFTVNGQRVFIDQSLR